MKFFFTGTGTFEKPHQQVWQLENFSDALRRAKEAAKDIFSGELDDLKTDTEAKARLWKSFEKTNYDDADINAALAKVQGTNYLEKFHNLNKYPGLKDGDYLKESFVRIFSDEFDGFWGSGQVLTADNLNYLARNNYWFKVSNGRLKVSKGMFETTAFDFGKFDSFQDFFEKNEAAMTNTEAKARLWKSFEKTNYDDADINAALAKVQGTNYLEKFHNLNKYPRLKDGDYLKEPFVRIFSDEFDGFWGSGQVLTADNLNYLARNNYWFAVTKNPDRLKVKKGIFETTALSFGSFDNFQDFFEKNEASMTNAEAKARLWKSFEKTNYDDVDINVALDKIQGTNYLEKFHNLNKYPRLKDGDYLKEPFVRIFSDEFDGFWGSGQVLTADNLNYLARNNYWFVVAGDPARLKVNKGTFEAMASHFGSFKNFKDFFDKKGTMEDPFDDEYNEVDRVSGRIPLEAGVKESPEYRDIKANFLKKLHINEAAWNFIRTISNKAWTYYKSHATWEKGFSKKIKSMLGGNDTYLDDFLVSPEGEEFLTKKSPQYDNLEDFLNYKTNQEYTFIHKTLAKLHFSDDDFEIADITRLGGMDEITVNEAIEHVKKKDYPWNWGMKAKIEEFGQLLRDKQVQHFLLQLDGKKSGAAKADLDMRDEYGNSSWANTGELTLNVLRAVKNCRYYINLEASSSFFGGDIKATINGKSYHFDNFNNEDDKKSLDYILKSI